MKEVKSNEAEINQKCVKEDVDEGAGNLSTCGSSDALARCRLVIVIHSGKLLCNIKKHGSEAVMSGNSWFKNRNFLSVRGEMAFCQKEAENRINQINELDDFY